MRTTLLVAIVAGVAIAGRAQAPAPPGAGTETGTQFYARYQAAIPKAATLLDLQAFWSAALIKEFNDAPPDQRVDLDGMKRIYGMLTAVSVVKETSSPTGATLTLEGVLRNGQKQTGTAYLIKEGGAWKLHSQESWPWQRRPRL